MIYSQVTSIVKQSEKSKSVPEKTLSVFHAGGKRVPPFHNSDKKPSVGALKKMACHTCKKLGHRKTARLTEKSPHECLKAYTTAAEFTSSLNQSGTNSSTNGNKDRPDSCKTIPFNMARASGHMQRNEKKLCPLADYGAEYSSIGIVKLKLYDELLVGDDIELDSIPAYGRHE